MEPPGDYLGGQLPVMPRTVGLPTWAALPDKAESTSESLTDPGHPVREIRNGGAQKLQKAHAGPCLC